MDRQLQVEQMAQQAIGKTFSVRRPGKTVPITGPIVKAEFSHWHRTRTQEYAVWAITIKFQANGALCDFHVRRLPT